MLLHNGNRHLIFGFVRLVQSGQSFVVAEMRISSQLHQSHPHEWLRARHSFVQSRFIQVVRNVWIHTIGSEKFEVFYHFRLHSFVEWSFLVSRVAFIEVRSVVVQKLQQFPCRVVDGCRVNCCVAGGVQQTVVRPVRQKRLMR